MSASAASITLVFHLFETDPMALVFLGVLALFAGFGRSLLLRHLKTVQSSKP